MFGLTTYRTLRPHTCPGASIPTRLCMSPQNGTYRALHHQGWRCFPLKVEPPPLPGERGDPRTPLGPADIFSRNVSKTCLRLYFLLDPLRGANPDPGWVGGRVSNPPFPPVGLKRSLDGEETVLGGGREEVVAGNGVPPPLS